MISSKPNAKPTESESKLLACMYVCTYLITYRADDEPRKQVWHSRNLQGYVLRCLPDYPPAYAEYESLHTCLTTVSDLAVWKTSPRWRGEYGFRRRYGNHR